MARNHFLDRLRPVQRRDGRPTDDGPNLIRPGLIVEQRQRSRGVQNKVKGPGYGSCSSRRASARLSEMSSSTRLTPGGTASLTSF